MISTAVDMVAAVATLGENKKEPVENTTVAIIKSMLVNFFIKIKLISDNK